MHTDEGRRRAVIGMLAHVDAGKTTLSEGLLYTCGAIRELGRVDKGTAFLDTHQLEKQRGITIFSKQAGMQLEDLDITLLDTPGHVDFSAEMERTLQVLDYAVLVISAADGVQGHTRTLWRLLKKHRIPVILFINKMDHAGADAKHTLTQLQERLDEGCIPFGAWTRQEMKLSAESEESFEPDKWDRERFLDALAMCSERMMESYLETGEISREQIVQAVQNREVFPCYFGSALRLTGIDVLLHGFLALIAPKAYGNTFGARVFKIARDAQGNRLTYLKLTGGSLRVKDSISYKRPLMAAAENSNEQDIVPDVSEKVDQIRIYSGEKYVTVQQLFAGQIAAVTGLRKTQPGQGLGIEEGRTLPMLVPVLTYQLLLPETVEAAVFLPKLRELEEELPELHVVWQEESEEILVQVMGEVQIEILRTLIDRRFGVDVRFDAGSIVYKETIAGTVYGVGHFEPLRHYAEVALRLEPLKIGAGLVFATECSEDLLARNWQRLVLTHLEERRHKGVLTGSEITDMKITLVAGKAHLKHTEGGDFRQATYRAVRQGLMEAESVLLEPWYEFCLEIPRASVGRAMTDLEQMHAVFSLEEEKEEAGASLSLIKGRVPVATFADYQRQVNAYSQGLGQLSCSFYGYFPCHNSEEVIASLGYEADRDMEQPADSVFCSHGAGIVVPWNQVKSQMHLVLTGEVDGTEDDAAMQPVQRDVGAGRTDSRWLSVEEVDQLLERAGSANKKSHIDSKKRWGQRFSQSRRTRESGYTAGEGGASHAKAAEKKEAYLLVDGYNIIFAWEDFKELANVNLDAARGKLQDLLCNYQAFVNVHVLLVFDAYRVKGHQTDAFPYHNIQVIFTKEAETADQYIERFAHDHSRHYDVTVATSDGLEQIIIRSQGCRLLSAKDFREECSRVQEEIAELLIKNK